MILLKLSSIEHVCFLDRRSSLVTRHYSFFSLVFFPVAVQPQVLIKTPKLLQHDPTRILKLDSEAQLDTSCLSAEEAAAFVELAIVTYKWDILDAPLNPFTFVAIGWSRDQQLTKDFVLSQQTRTNTRALLLNSLKLREGAHYLFEIQGTVTYSAISLSSSVCYVHLIEMLIEF